MSGSAFPTSSVKVVALPQGSSSIPLTNPTDSTVVVPASGKVKTRGTKRGCSAVEKKTGEVANKKLRETLLVQGQRSSSPSTSSVGSPQMLAADLRRPASSLVAAAVSGSTSAPDLSTSGVVVGSSDSSSSEGSAERSPPPLPASADSSSGLPDLSALLPDVSAMTGSSQRSVPSSGGTMPLPATTVEDGTTEALDLSFLLPEACRVSGSGDAPRSLLSSGTQTPPSGAAAAASSSVLRPESNGVRSYAPAKAIPATPCPMRAVVMDAFKLGLQQMLTQERIVIGVATFGIGERIDSGNFSDVYLLSTGEVIKLPKNFKVRNSSEMQRVHNSARKQYEELCKHESELNEVDFGVLPTGFTQGVIIQPFCTFLQITWSRDTKWEQLTQAEIRLLEHMRKVFAYFMKLGLPVDIRPSNLCTDPMNSQRLLLCDFYELQDEDDPDTFSYIVHDQLTLWALGNRAIYEFLDPRSAVSAANAASSAGESALAGSTEAVSKVTHLSATGGVASDGAASVANATTAPVLSAHK